MYTLGEKIIPRDIEEEIKDSYISYAMSVIVGRALPDVRDGLKPVHRRVLYAMRELGLDPGKPYKKSARIVGDCLGKYHPHGDVAVYDSLVRMVQDFSLRYPLVDGQGNFGCFTGDTKIKLVDGTVKTFEELTQRPPEEPFYVYAVNQGKEIVIGRAHHARITRRNAALVEVALDNGQKLRCTPDHRFLLRSGVYKQTKDLTPADSLMAGYFDRLPISEEVAEAVPGQNHCAVGVRELDERADVYDITVDEHHNFLLDAGVFVHNSVDGDSAASMRYCVTGDTLVVTGRGLVPIKDLSPTQAEDVRLSVLSRDRAVHSASKWFDSGEHPTLRVTTARGLSLQGSHNHPILTWATHTRTGQPAFRWKLLSQLRVGDVAVIDRTADTLWPSARVNTTAYWPMVGARRIEPKTLPRELDEHVAHILGALVAEGTVKEHELEFCNGDAVWMQEFDIRWQKTFPDCRLHRFARTPNSYGKKPYYTREIHSNHVIEFLRGIGLSPVKSRGKTVPFLVLRSPKSVVAEFLRAYFEGDGSISVSGRMTELSCISVSETLIDELQVLLLRFGIAATKRFDRYRGTHKLYIRGLENYRRFQLHIGFVSERKNKKLSQAIARQQKERSATDFIPFISNFARTHLDKGQRWNGREFVLKHNFDRYGNLEDRSARVVATIEPKAQVVTAAMFRQLLKTRYFFDPIVKTEDGGVARVYSLKVDSACHSFVANGFINHNTEARLAPIAEELLADIDKDTVDFGPNFDGSLMEPKLLPAKLPNLLVNGSSGIAVGMATNVPPHNLGEVIDGLCALIDEPEIELPALMRRITGPDFPTGAILCGRDGIKDAYATGRGSLRIRAKAQVEQMKGNRQAIIITELPYQVNKATLLETIARLVQEKQLEGISDLRDESDKDGTRVMIELKRDANDQVVLNQLYKHTQLETSFGVIMLALVDGRPRVLGLKGLLQAFLEHRKEIVTRRTKFELAKAKDRAHILEGLKIALANLDAIIKTIRQSKSPAEAKESLVKKFDLSEKQAQAILEMQLQRLTALERDKIEAEYQELLKKIAYYEMLLKSEKKILDVIKDELLELRKKFADERRTQIVGEVQDLKIEDLIADEDVVLTVSHRGYIKRLPVSAYRKQRRGGVGVTAVETQEEDFVVHLFVASTHETLMFFTDQGRCYWLPVHEVPQAGRYARGTAIVNLLALQKDEQIRAFVAVKEFVEGQFLVMATKQGTIKKTVLSAYANQRKAGIIAITLEPGDGLIEAKVTDGKQELLLVTRLGKAIRFPEEQAREVGRAARGVRGIRLEKHDEVVSMVVAHAKADVLTMTELGFGKRSSFEEYRVQSRGGKGIINIKVTDRNGKVVGAKTVSDRDEVMLISHEGMIVRCAVKDVRETGRAAQGVRLINIKGNDRVVSVASVVPREAEEAELSQPPEQEAAAAPAPAAAPAGKPAPVKATAKAPKLKTKAPAPKAKRRTR